jgi:hypothetical protein
VPGPLLVRVEQPVPKLGHGKKVRDRPDRPRRIDATQEQRFRHIDRPEARQVPLVKQRLADRTAGVAGEARHGGGRVPVLAEQVGTEVPRDLVFPCGRQDLSDAEQVPGGQPALVGEHQPELVAAPERPAPGPVGGLDPPVALHFQVRVDGEAVVRADQQVLAACDRFSDDVAGEADGGVSGHAEVTAGQHLAGEGRVQPPGGVPYDVAFWHGPSLPEAVSYPAAPSVAPVPGGGITVAVAAPALVCPALAGAAGGVPVRG